MRHTALVQTLALLIAISTSSNALAGQACLKEQLAVGKLTREVGLLDGKVSRSEDIAMTRQEQGELRLASLSASVANAKATASAAAANAAGRGVACAWNGGRCAGGAAAQFISEVARANAQVRAAERRYDAFAQAHQKQMQRLNKQLGEDRAKLTQKKAALDRAQDTLAQCADQHVS